MKVVHLDCGGGGMLGMVKTNAAASGRKVETELSFGQTQPTTSLCVIWHTQLQIWVWLEFMLQIGDSEKPPLVCVHLFKRMRESLQLWAIKVQSE